MNRRASIGECDVNPNYMLYSCSLSCGKLGKYKPQKGIIMPKDANAQGKPLEVSLQDGCQDRHTKCSDFAAQGHCDGGPGV